MNTHLRTFVSVFALLYGHNCLFTIKECLQCGAVLARASDTMQTRNSLFYELLIRLFLHRESVCMCVRTVLCYHVSGNSDIHCVRMQGMKEEEYTLRTSLMKTAV